MLQRPSNACRCMPMPWQTAQWPGRGRPCRCAGAVPFSRLRRVIHLGFVALEAHCHLHPGEGAQPIKAHLIHLRRAARRRRGREQNTLASVRWRATAVVEERATSWAEDACAVDCARRRTTIAAITAECGPAAPQGGRRMPRWAARVCRRREAAPALAAHLHIRCEGAGRHPAAVPGGGGHVVVQAACVHVPQQPAASGVQRAGTSQGGMGSAAWLGGEEHCRCARGRPQP